MLATIQGHTRHACAGHANVAWRWWRWYGWASSGTRQMISSGRKLPCLRSLATVWGVAKFTRFSRQAISLLAADVVPVRDTQSTDGIPAIEWHALIWLF
ncbi:hypothetical protein PtB15_3B208 [Puccinia triticina]|nr:hypothetical protein PtB15_3B208 [Puccinia triticina]